MIRDLLHPILTVMLSYSLALAPFALLGSKPAFAQPPEAKPNLATQLFELESRLDQLLDRAQFPNVPRLGVRGLPSVAELREVEVRVGNMTQDFRANFLNRVQQIEDTNLQWLPLQDLAQFYSIAQKVESLKVIIGTKSDPDSYASQYGMDFSLHDLSQLNFFTKLAFSGRNNVEIEDLVSPQKFPMATELMPEGRGARVEVRLNSDFLKIAEYQRFAVQMNMRSSLLFAAHYAAEGMHKAEALTTYLGPAEAAPVREVSDFWRSRFASFKVLREEILRARANEVYARTKPLLVRAIKDSLVEMQKSGAGFSLNSSFWSSYQVLRGAPPPNLNLPAIQVEETQAFHLAITAVTRLWDLQDLSANIAPAIGFAKRLSLRFLVLNNPNLVASLTPVQLRLLERLVDSRAAEFAQQMTDQSSLKENVKKILTISPERVRQDVRARFLQQLTKMSKQIQNFATQDVNLQYLFESKRTAIQALAPSALVAQTVSALEQIGHYSTGYSLYRQSLLTLLQAYTYPSAEKPTIKYLGDNADKIRFNPSSLVDSVPTDYIRALEQDPSGRAKDVRDLLSLGRLLKFDVYETLPQNSRATLDNLNIQDGRFFSGERAAYLEALKKDVLTAAPVLNSRDLYIQLADDTISGSTRAQAVAAATSETQIQAAKNIEALEKQMRLIEQGPENALTNVGNEMRVLVTRTSQMSLVLGSISGFSSFFDEIRQELLLPGFWGDQWNKFNSWTSMANLALIVFFAANILAKFSGVAGRISDVVIYLLSPIFGPNLRHLSTAIWTLIGLNLGDAAIRSGLEQQRLGVLKDYYRCNAAAPCVALYSDVSRQEDIRNAALTELGTLLIVPVILIGGFMLAAGVGARIATGISNKLLRQVEADMQTLNISSGGSLGQVALNNARGAAHSSISAVGNPVARELSAIYVEQAYSRLQSLILKEARKFSKFDRRLKTHTDRIGLTLGEAKNIESLAARHGQIEQAYRAGQMTSSEYVDKVNSVFAIFQAYSPIWSRMTSSPNLASFYEAIWNANIPAGQAQVMIRSLNQSLIRDFSARMNEFYGTDSRRVDGVVKKLLDEIENSPEISADRIQKLRRLINRSRP